MAVAVVTIYPNKVPGGPTMFKYVCDAAPSATNINIGFVPSYVRVWNSTDGDRFAEFSTAMAAGKGIKTVNASSPTQIASGGFTLVQQTDGTNHGFSVGTDAGVQVASKTFEGIAFP